MKTSTSVYWVGLSLLMFFLTGCGAQPTLIIPATPSIILTVAPTETTFPSSPTSSPAKIATVAAHPLALNEFNAGTQMSAFNIYGTGKLQAITFSPDGKYLAVATDRGIYLYDGKSFEPISFINVNDSVTAIAFSVDGLTIAAATNGKVSLWGTLSGQKLSELRSELISISLVAYSKIGYVAAFGPSCPQCIDIKPNVMAIWDTNTGQRIHTEEAIWHSTESLVFMSDGKRLAFMGPSGLTLMDVATGKLETYHSTSDDINFEFDPPLSFIFSNDESLLFVASTALDSGQIIQAASKHAQFFPLCMSTLIRANNMGACFAQDIVFLFNLSDGKKRSELNIPRVGEKDFR